MIENLIWAAAGFVIGWVACTFSFMWAEFKKNSRVMVSRNGSKPQPVGVARRRKVER